MSKQRTIANNLVPGSTMHPGVLISNELKARKMRQIELAKKLGIAKNVMSELINGKRNITAALAIKLEKAFDIKAEFWMKHQATYELDKIRIRNNREITTL